MKPPPPPGLWLVARREIRFFHRDRAGWFLVVAIPLIAFAILAWTFGSAVVRGLNVVIVDMDRSAVSTGVIQRIAAAPGQSRSMPLALEADTAVRVLAPGELLFRQGDPAEAIYKVESGRLRPVAPPRPGSR